MKKCCLFIVLLVCFCQAFAGAANSNASQQALISPDKKDVYTFLAANYPHTEFEISYHTVSAGSSCRQQHLPGFIPSIEAVHFSPGNQLTVAKKSCSQAWHQQYLFHIYPSHHFW